MVLWHDLLAWINNAQRIQKEKVIFVIPWVFPLLPVLKLVPVCRRFLITIILVLVLLELVERMASRGIIGKEGLFQKRERIAPEVLFYLRLPPSTLSRSLMAGFLIYYEIQYGGFQVGIIYSTLRCVDLYHFLFNVVH